MNRTKIWVSAAALALLCLGLTARTSIAQDPPAPRPSDKPAQSSPMPMMTGQVSITSTEKFVFILQGDRLIKVDAESMKVTGESKVPVVLPKPRVGPGSQPPMGGGGLDK